MLLNDLSSKISGFSSIKRTSNNSVIWQQWVARTEFVVIFCAFALLYFLTRSASLDEIDSINLALGVREFNLSLHQPHAPGAPIFVFLGKIIHSIGFSIKDALQLVEACGGGLFVASSFLLTSILYNRTAGYWLAFLLAMTPGVWMTAGKVMSDALSAGVTILAVVFLLKALSENCRRPAYIILFSFTLVMAIGVRPPVAPTLLILLIIALLTRVPIRYKLYAVLVFAIGNLCWLLPTIISQAVLEDNTHGWMNFFVQLREFKNHSTSIDTWHFDPSNGNLVYALKRLFLHLGGMLYFGMGFSLWYPEWVNQLLGHTGTELTPWNTNIQEWSLGGSIFLFVSILAFGRFFSRKYQWRVSGFWIIAIPLGIFYFFYIYLTVPPLMRYYIPLFPLILMPVVLGLYKSRYGKVGLLIAVLSLGSSSLPLALEQNANSSPSLAFLEAVEQHSKSNSIPPEKVVLYCNSNVRRHAYWYYPEFKLYEEGESFEQVLLETSGAVVYSNIDQLIEKPGSNVLVLDRFSRSLRVWMRHPQINLYFIDNRQSQTSAFQSDWYG